MRLMMGDLKIHWKSLNIFDDKTSDCGIDYKKFVRIFQFGKKIY
jgi:hypothetical protein